MSTHLEPKPQRRRGLVPLNQVRPRPVHSQELGADLVLQTALFWPITAAVLPSFAQDKCLRHLRERRCWDVPSAHRANREFFSSYSASQQQTTGSGFTEARDERKKGSRRFRKQKGKPGERNGKILRCGLPRSGFCSLDELIFLDILAVTETNTPILFFERLKKENRF